MIVRFTTFPIYIHIYNTYEKKYIYFVSFYTEVGGREGGIGEE